MGYNYIKFVSIYNPLKCIFHIFLRMGYFYFQGKKCEIFNCEITKKSLQLLSGNGHSGDYSKYMYISAGEVLI